MRTQINRSSAAARLLAAVLVVHASLVSVVAADTPSPASKVRSNGPAASAKTGLLQVKPNARLRVVDENGGEIDKFEVRGSTVEKRRTVWAKSANGRASVEFLTGLPDSKSIDLTVRAADYATATGHFSGPKKEQLLRGDSTIVLPRGELVRVHFRLPQGMIWFADMQPDIYFAEDVATFQGLNLFALTRREYAREMGGLLVRKLGNGVCEFRLTRDSSPIFAGINVAGFLRNFERGPFTLADFKKGVLDVDVDRPATLTVHVNWGDHKSSRVPAPTWNLEIHRPIPGRRGTQWIVSEEEIPPSQEFMDNFPSGNYSVSMQTVSKVGDPVPAFYDSRRVKLVSGQSERIDFQVMPYNSEAFRGDRTAILRIEKPDGAPASGHMISVIYSDNHYGRIPVFSGRVPPSGQIVLKKITEKGLKGAKVPPYSVWEGEDFVDYFGLKSHDTSETFKLVLAPKAGDMAPNVDLTNVSAGRHARLKDFEGRVVCLDFWATWCGPCQKPLKDLDAFADVNGKRLKDRVVVIPVSVDDQRDQVAKHVNKQGWSHLDHFWAGPPGEYGFHGEAGRAFVISKFPTTILIDRRGRILWRGDPTVKVDGKDLETRIEEAAQN